MSVLCGLPTPTGPCRRPVKAPGGPCGATHTDLVSPTGAPPSGTFQAAPGANPLLSAPDRSAERNAGRSKPVLAAAAAVAALPVEFLDRFDLAGNALAGPGVLDTLASDSSPDVRGAVAANPSAPPAVLARLAGDKSQSVRCDVAAHPACPAATLAALAGDPDPDVRSAAEARVPGTPPVRLAELARHDNWQIRLRVASRTDSPAVAVAELAGDPDPAVRGAARSHPTFRSSTVRAHTGLLDD